jgi:hypothetical protein
VRTNEAAPLGGPRDTADVSFRLAKAAGAPRAGEEENHQVSEAEEVVAPFRIARELVRPTTAFKSTWLTASLDTLRSRGHFDRYLERLPVEHHEPVLGSIAGVWLPVEVCIAHYRACDALALTVAEQIMIGRGVLQRLQRTIFSLAFRVAREAGVTPWNILKTFPNEFDRQWRGGACGIFKLGPKDARFEMIGFPVAAIPYARTALRGMVMGLAELVCTKCYVHDIRERCDDMTIAYRVAWA